MKWSFSCSNWTQQQHLFYLFSVFKFEERTKQKTYWAAVIQVTILLETIHPAITTSNIVEPQHKYYPGKFTLFQKLWKSQTLFPGKKIRSKWSDTDTIANHSLQPCFESTLIARCLEGWSGGAKVLGKLPVPGRPTNLDYSRARAYCACNRCGWGLFGHFFLIYHFSFLSPSLWETA